MSKKNLDPRFERRTLLKAAAGFAGGMLLGGLPFRAFAQSAALAPADRCFVFVYFNGGWDQLLALDPKDPAQFTADSITETRILPGYDLITDTSFPDGLVTPAERPGAGPSNIVFGPAIGNLAKHYDLMTVVRGINMTTLSHDVGYRYFLTGKPPIGSAARGSSTATEIVGQMASPQPIPSVAFGVESYNDRYPGSANALRVTRRQDLLLTLSPSSTQLDSEIEKQLVDFKGQPVTCEAQLYDTRGLVGSYQTSRGQMRAVLDAKLANYFAFDATDVTKYGAPLVAEMAELRQSYGLNGADGKPSTTLIDGARGRAALVATALKRGISQCLSINLVGGLDTHFGTQTLHAQRLREGFDALSALVDDLRATEHPNGGNFMEHTTIMVFSEFARTPLINATGGRDHHLSSSCLLMGKGVRHNYVLGKSGDIGMAPGRINPVTGELDPNGENIFPDQIIASVLASAGLDYSILRTQPLKPLLGT